MSVLTSLEQSVNDRLTLRDVKNVCHLLAKLETQFEKTYTSTLLQFNTIVTSYLSTSGTSLQHVANLLRESLISRFGTAAV